MATFGIGALTVEIGHAVAQVIGFRNSAALATLFTVNAHPLPLSRYNVNVCIIPKQTLFVYTAPITSCRKFTQSERGIPLLLMVSFTSSHKGNTSLRV